MAYFGLVPLSTNLLAGQKTQNAANTLQNADAAPSYRVYGPNGLLGNGTGTMTLRDTGVITAASNATPIVITSTAHNLSSGTLVTIAGVLGNTAANGNFTVTVLTANTFSLNSSVGNGVYTSGGTWNVTGLYVATILLDPAQGFQSGQSYWFFASWACSGLSLGDLSTFTCI